MAPCSMPSTFYDAWDTSLPADHPFVTRALQFHYPLSPIEPIKSCDMSLSVQSRWNGDSSPYWMGYYPDMHPYTNQLSPLNSGLSPISSPQSPCSSKSGCVSAMTCSNSPSFQPTEPVTGVEHPVPDSLVDSNILPQFRAYEVQSSRTVTPEQHWSPQMYSEVKALAQAPKRSQGRFTPNSRVCKPGRRPKSRAGRSCRRQGIVITDNDDSQRVFVCSFAPYGCDSTFVSKNEWKRHVSSQHIQLGFYRCDVGKCNVEAHKSKDPSSPAVSPCNRGSSPLGQPNDFNRKDLFTQHHRRMHAPWLQLGRRRKPTDAERADFEAGLEAVRQRCWHGLRQQPTRSHCGFCHEVFSGEGSWDARMEHVGRHFERDDLHSLGEEAEDLALRDWGLREGILTLVDGQCRLKIAGHY
ncbi:hypothetical protein NUU61_005960 [Penicillium alfredii]|uniref:C2H2-type domain-containing protein n=1 Tax=Penicillium alfredii TaxID=1506179 RepID=A0A9W9F053_9EURO|nr:uncharacterized protein NUU61_005960 [Penicillium alfredii]KAJ5091090.1 hypothetical protein NUU61_005960 [Penicillium alfredii]